MSNSLTSNIIADGVRFHHVTDERFKTNRISIHFITELKTETASKNAIIPFLLKRGYNGCDDFMLFHEKLQELYGAYVSGYIQKTGDYQIVSLSITGIDDSFALEKESIAEKMAEILSRMALDPSLKNGVFDGQLVELEKNALIDTVEAEINEKRIYAINRLISIMCENEPFGISKYGKKEEIAALTSALIKEAYDKLIETAQVEIMFVGKGNQSIAQEVFEKAFTNINRQYHKLEKIKTHIPVDNLIEKTENMSVTQAKMVLGFSSQTPADDETVTAVKLMVAVLGGSTSSKLFINVREKMSLCYYCAARYDRFKGVMMLDSGIEKENIEKAKEAIIAQLEAIKNGDISDEELHYAELSLKNTLRTVYDYDSSIEGWYLGQVLSNTAISPMDEAANLSKVTKADVISVAKKMKLDAVYVLTGNEVE